MSLKMRERSANAVSLAVSRGRRTAADAARLFDVHPATDSRLLAHARMETTMAQASDWRSSKEWRE
jgi:hypothetical protein